MLLKAGYRTVYSVYECLSKGHTPIVTSFKRFFDGSDSRVYLQCGRPGFDPSVGKNPWRRKWQPTPIFLPGSPWMEKPHGLESIALQRVGTRPSDFTFTSGAFLIGQPVKYLPAKQETQVPSLSREDPLEKEMATYSSIISWRTPYGQRSLAGYSRWVHKCWTRLSN